MDATMASIQPTAAKRGAGISHLAASSPVMRMVATILAFLAAAYLLLPFYWMIIASLKTNGGVIGSFGLLPPAHPNLWQNLQELVTYQDGIFVRWVVNSVFYTGIGGVAATLMCLAAGYSLSIYRFRARLPILGVIVGSSAVPATTLALPLYLLVALLGLANKPLGLFLPLTVAPFGVFLMWLYFDSIGLSALVEAARVDGGSELRIFGSVALPVAAPAVVTVFLLTIVGIWNNYLLPLLLLTNPRTQPLTVGLASWAAAGGAGAGAGKQLLYTLVITGSLITMIPILALFLVLQRYWRSGLGMGSVTG